MHKIHVEFGSGFGYDVFVISRTDIRNGVMTSTEEIKQEQYVY